MTEQEDQRRYPFKGEAGITFDNTSKLLVPGFDLPAPIELPHDERFAHGFLDWSQNRLTAREIAMLRLMNTITDRPQWHTDLLQNHDVVATWAEEALSNDPLISPATWNWCLAELRDKAALYDKSKITHVFDSASRICKSDHSTSPSLLERLAAEVKSLPHLVDPDMFPLVYGRTRVLAGGYVGRTGAVECAGQGFTSTPPVWRCSSDARVTCDGVDHHGRFGDCGRCGRSGGSRDEESWEPGGGRFSFQFQWLPSEVRFGSPEKESGISVTSYINNLHPRQSSTLYGIIEECIAASILPWNEVLIREKGRTPERIRTYGVQWSPEMPKQSELDDLRKLLKKGDHNAEARLRSFLEQPDNPLAPPISNWDRNPSNLSWAVHSKYRRCKRWLHPEPGVSFTYQDWKEGRNNRAIVPARGTEGWKDDWSPAIRGETREVPKEDHEFYTVDLEHEFAKQGLQVVVEIGGVDLTPERPVQDAIDWQLSGLPNDHIVATTVIHFSENVTPTSMSFKVEADLDPLAHVWGTKTGSRPYHPLAPLADIYGCDAIEDLGCDDDETTPGGPATQTLGSVKTPNGRLLAFPNVMQHRTEEFSLLDPTRPGCSRFLKIHLVDPHYRVCSTRNVPPQRFDWWYEAGLGRIDWAEYGLPAELRLNILDLVEKDCRDFPISSEDAERIRQDIRRERERKYEHVNENTALYWFIDSFGIGGKYYWQ